MNRSQIWRLFIIVLTAVLLLGFVALAFSWYSQSMDIPDGLDVMQQSSTQFGFAIKQIDVMYPSSLRPYQTDATGQRDVASRDLIWDQLNMTSEANNMTAAVNFKFVFDSIKVYSADGNDLLAYVKITQGETTTTLEVFEYSLNVATYMGKAVLQNIDGAITYFSADTVEIPYLYNNYLYIALNTKIRLIENTVTTGATVATTSTTDVATMALHQNRLTVTPNGGTDTTISSAYQISFDVMDDIIEQALIGKNVKFSVKMTEVR